MRWEFFEGKVAIVTGGAQGIGRGIVEALAKEGSHVILVDVEGDLAVEAAREVARHGVMCKAVIGDVGLQATAEQACRVAESSRVISRSSSTAPKAWSRASPSTTTPIRTSTWPSRPASGAPFDSCGAGLPLLSVNGGSVVNIVSSAGTHGLAGFAGYAAAKEGIRGLTKVAANEWGPLGIRVNALSPQASTAKTEAYFELHPERLAEKLASGPSGGTAMRSTTSGGRSSSLPAPTRASSRGRRSWSTAGSRSCPRPPRRSADRAGRPQRWHAPPPASRSRWRGAPDSAMI